MDDIKQEAFMIAVEALEKYDESRPLENFLYISISNRLKNLLRRECNRNTPPCVTCPLNAYVNEKCTAYHDMMECSFYKKWHNKCSIKKNLINPITFDNVDDENEDNMKQGEDVVNFLHRKEIITILDDCMPYVSSSRLHKDARWYFCTKSRYEAVIDMIKQLLADRVSMSNTKKKRGRLNNKEQQYIIDNFKSKSTKSIADVLNRSQDAIEKFYFLQGWMGKIKVV